MVKRSPFQQDLFDFKYIEDQVAEINKTMETTNEITDEQALLDVLNDQLSVLQDIQTILTNIENNTKKKSWFK